MKRHFILQFQEKLNILPLSMLVSIFFSLTFSILQVMNGAISPPVGIGLLVTLCITYSLSPLNLSLYPLVKP